MWLFDRFHYPDYAAAIFIGLSMIALSFPLSYTPIHPIVGFLIRYIGLLVSFFGVVWYGFNWVIDYGPDFVRSLRE